MGSISVLGYSLKGAGIRVDTLFRSVFIYDMHLENTLNFQCPLPLKGESDLTRDPSFAALKLKLSTLI